MVGDSQLFSTGSSPAVDQLVLMLTDVFTNQQIDPDRMYTYILRSYALLQQLILSGPRPV